MSADKFKTVYGLHVLRLLLEKEPERILEIFLLKDRKDQRAEEILTLAKTQGVAVHFAAKKQLDSLSEAQNHQGAVAKIKPKSALSESDLLTELEELIEQKHIGERSVIRDPLLLVLDGVQDPHNLGACLRTADAAGVMAIVIPKDRAVGLTAVVLKTASGAAETVPVVTVTNLARFLQQIKELGFWIFGASGEAEKTLYEVDCKGPLAIVLGAEGEGLRRLTMDNCDVLFKIPMLGVVESLNVSVATGICLYEALRQRQIQK